MSWSPFPRRVDAALPAAVFAVGLCLAAAVSLKLHRDAETQAQAEFQRSVERVASDIARRFRQPIYALNGAEGLYAASAQVDRGEFRAYADTRGPRLEMPGVRGLGFIERVERSRLEAFVAAERVDHAPRFAVHGIEPSGHDDLYIIKFIEPARGNAGALGLDLGSERVRREGAERAVRTGETTLTETLTLVQDERRGPGFLMYHPVYRGGTVPATPQQRRAALVGLLYVPIVAAELLGGVADAEAGLVEFDLFDTPDAPGPTAAASPARLVFGSVAHSADAAAPGTGRYSATRTVALPGRSLGLQVRATPRFEASADTSPAWLVFGAGALTSALLAALLGQQASGRRRAEALAADMTADLARLALVARRTSNAVIITDRQLRITWVNDAFTRLYGHSHDEALGRTPGDLLGSGKSQPQALETLRRSAETGSGCRVELVNRAADGRDVWVDTEVQPALDAAGQVIGFIEITSDTTASRQATRELEAQQRSLANIIDSTRAGTWEVDLATGEDKVNAAFAEMIGYTLPECSERLRRDGFPSLLHPDDVARLTQARQAHIDGLTRDYDCEFRMRHRAGHWVWIHSRGRVSERDGPGGARALAGIHLDISARMQAECALAHERQALADIIEGTNVGTWEWNVATGETRFNERWAQIVGHRVDELLPMSLAAWAGLVHPDDAQRSAALLEQHFAGLVPRYECELRMRHKDGHWVWVLDRGKLFSRSAEGRPHWMAGTLMDITERKQAEAALRASQALLDRTGRIGGVGGWAYDLASQVIHWTDQTCRIHDLEAGHQPTFEEILGYYAPQARPVLEQAVRRSLAHGDGYDLELPLVTATGRHIWVRAVGETEFVDGQPVRMVGALQDITARCAMESELRRNNELLGSVLESMPCGMSVFDGDLNLVVANTEFRRLLALPDALFDARPTPFERIIRHNAERGDYRGEHGDDVEAAVAARVALARGPAVPHQFERVLPDGTTLEVRGSPMPGGGFVTTHIDITGRRRAEAQLRRSDQLLRGAIDTIDEAFVLFDPDDRLVLCNDKYRSLYTTSSDLMVPGARFEDIVRQGALRGQYPAAVGRVDAWVAERMAAHRAGNTELVQRLDDGRSLRIVERHMPDGHIVGFRIDITELVRATEAAQAASLAKSQFLANMSHEIRTPMNAILGMLTLLRKTPLTPRQADYAGKTAGAAHSLLALLNDVLDYSKVEADRMVLDPHPFSVEQLLQDLSVILSANVGARPVNVWFDIDPAVPTELVGDAMRLQQVLVNLGGNAVKFTERGEVVLSIMVTGRSADAVTLEFAVRDTGIGIAADNHTRIFSGFTQAEASTTRRYGGTGLGLAICQRLVGLMGGELLLDSAPGVGSRFRFCITLPSVAGAVPGAAADAAGPANATPLRALVLDERPTARALLRGMGQALGWQLELADTGERASAMLQRAAHDDLAYQALLVDAQAPQLHAWLSRQAVPAPGLAADAAVVLMVGAQGRERLAQADPGGALPADAFLVEPFTAAMLSTTVAAARRTPGQAEPAGKAAQPEPGRLSGLRLLLVEDNLNNCQVARELLEGEGATVQVAHDGQAAVDALAAARPPCDAVLMDLQMPVMDGYTATGLIRRRLGLHELPIVAMTANALATDREACLAVGMNDHVGKPFDLNHLVQVLQRLTGRVPATSPQHPAAVADLDDAVVAAADAAGIDIAAALGRLGDRPALYRRLLRGFVADLAALPDQLAACIGPADAATTARRLHTLKGLAATLGATALSAGAAHAEALLAGGPAPAAVAAAVSTAIHHVQSAGPGLRSLLQAFDAPPRDTPSPNPPVDPVALNAAVSALATLLQNSDMRATDAMAELLQAYGAALPDPLARLDAAIGRLDFVAAALICTALLEANTA